MDASRAVPLVGRLPAASRGVRFGASGCIKDLFPLLLTSDSDDRILEPRPLCEMAPRAIRAAGAGADLTLGCFPVDEPERFGPVEVAPDGTILRILDEPPRSLIERGVLEQVQAALGASA